MDQEGYSHHNDERRSWQVVDRRKQPFLRSDLSQKSLTIKAASQAMMVLILPSVIVCRAFPDMRLLSARCVTLNLHALPRNNVNRLCVSWRRARRLTAARIEQPTVDAAYIDLALIMFDAVIKAKIPIASPIPYPIGRPRAKSRVDVSEITAW